MRDTVRVLAVQTVIREAIVGPQLQRSIDDNLFRAVALVDKAAARSGAADLVVLPEFFLTGYASTRSHDEAFAMARTLPGRETDVLGALAQRHGCYVAGAAWAIDPRWPDRFFNTAFIIGPTGELELTYRKINEGNYQAGLTATTPGDIYDEFVAQASEDDMFPVLATPFGTLACVICFDLNFPETVRRLAMRGAEIICNPTGEVNGSYLDVWQCTRRSRAIENQCAWVSANHGGYIAARTEPGANAPLPEVFEGVIDAGNTPASPSHGRSQVLDHRGEVVAMLDGPGESILDAYVDLRALRAARAAAPAEGLPTAASITAAAAAVYAVGYARAPGFPLNRLSAQPLCAPSDGARHLAQVAQDLRGTTIVPTGAVAPVAALAFQADVPYAPREASARDLAAMIAASVMATREPLAAEVDRSAARLVVLPDGWPLGRRRGTEVAAVSLALDGAAFDPVRALAADARVHLAGSVLASVRGVAARVGFIVAPDGALASTRAAAVALPGGYEAAVDDDPVRTLRLDAASSFPVLESPYGRLAVVVGREILSVEVVRLLTMAGAEVLLHPVGELDRTVAAMIDPVRRTRAAENLVHVVSAAPGPLGGGVPAGAACGSSVVVDCRGAVLDEVAAGTSAGAVGRLDLNGQRAARAFGPGNNLLQLRPQLYVGGYAARAAADEQAPESYKQ